MRRAVVALGVLAFAGYAGAQSISVTGTMRDPVTSAPFSVTVSQQGGGAGAAIMPAERYAGGSPTGNWTMTGLTTKGGLAPWLARSTICATLSPRGGNQDDTNAIQTAVNNCPAGQVVKLNAGTFVMNQTGVDIRISKGITLRGAGPGQTIINKTNGAVPRTNNVIAGTNGLTSPQSQSNNKDLAPIIVIGQNRWPSPDSTTSQNLIADGAQGAMSITVSNASSPWQFAVGQFVLLDETTGTGTPPPPVWSGNGGSNGTLANPTGSWQTPTQPGWTNKIWGGDRVMWRMWLPVPSGQSSQSSFSDTTGPFDRNGGNQRIVPWEMGWYSRVDRGFSEIKEIASVSGNTITFTSPLTDSYRVSHNAALTAYSQNTCCSTFVTYAGVENMTLVGAGNGAVEFEAAAYSWAWNLDIKQWIDGGINIQNSFRIQVGNVYIHYCSWPVPGGGGYALDINTASSELLIQDNILMDCDKVLVVRAAGAGSVIAYNYTDNGWMAGNETIPEVGINASHAAGSHHVLLEGNYSWNASNDFTHGGSPYITFFRNWLTGQRRDLTDSNTVNIVGPDTYSWWQTFVGNVLGYSTKPSWIWSGGKANTASGFLLTDPTMNCQSDGSNCIGGLIGNWQNSVIWFFGFDPENWNAGAEPNTLSTIIRDGNWDFKTNAQHWYNTPGGFTLPNSLYLSSKPAFFGSNSWPWTDATTGTINVLPALARYNAGTPNAAISP